MHVPYQRSTRRPGGPPTPPREKGWLNRSKRRDHHSDPDMQRNPERPGRPNPMRAENTAEFIALLNHYREWSGLSLGDIELYSGGMLNRAGIQETLHDRDSLPRRIFVLAFVSACGADSAEVARWSAVHRRLRSTEQGADPETPEQAVARLTGQRPPPG
ncbi:hypothetical protein GCM10027440_06130 [Nocardiopsis coralliicola]